MKKVRDIIKEANMSSVVAKGQVFYIGNSVLMNVDGQTVKMIIDSITDAGVVLKNTQTGSMVTMSNMDFADKLQSGMDGTVSEEKDMEDEEDDEDGEGMKDKEEEMD
ncbi:hypothetical protein [uncultured Arcobacter sp.]|uniref:hypothetical protein n=1 Tax=uncultured Arcobacter sp. TaxID=165434 RepID=UPI00260A1932|nr:hypothetical protein [uncultured Arcobacter sp.]